MLPVVIGTNPERTEWLADCVASIKATTERPFIIHRHGGYEIAALRTATTHFDRFLFIHDSVTILSPLFWGHIDARQGSAWLSGWPSMFMGIWDTETLQPYLDEIPDRVSKEATIALEADLHARFDYSTIWPEVRDGTAKRREHRHGRDNLVLGNELWEKHKGTHR